VAETFETAVTWDRFGDFHEGVLAAVRQAMDHAYGGGVVSCRFAYVYPDGPAPYYSVYAPGRPGRELEQWDEIKLAASERRSLRSAAQSPITTRSGATIAASGQPPCSAHCVLRPFLA
jgi:hypothetical protein